MTHCEWKHRQLDHVYPKQLRLQSDHILEFWMRGIYTILILHGPSLHL